MTAGIIPCNVPKCKSLMENYQFIKQIGQGSYGEVWLVKCSKTRKKHVLKRIDLHQASKREQRAAHLEAKLLSTIKHPNIVTYLDSFLNSFGSLFIVMNYCECGDLYTFIKHQNSVYFEEKQIVHWFVQICLALKYLHDKNILHRNLKTRNIFLTRNKIIKVGDLGISKVLSIAHEMTATLIETPYYISPEIFAGKSYSEKADIWALGCCTYEITTLRHPFIAQDIHSLLQKVMKRKLPSIPGIYSFELYEIISSMLNQAPESRPSVTQLLLNDYIRRYILLILQDNSKSPDSQNSENLSELAMERSKSNSDLSLAMHKSTSNDIQRSLSTCFLPRNTIKNVKKSSAVVKNKASSGKSLFITVPDVNGNGDGNDNSQHGRIMNANRRAAAIVNRDEIHSENNYKNPGDAHNDIKKPVKMKTNSASNSDVASRSSLNNSELSAIASQQKMKGELSLQILNNLASSLHSTRQENYKDSSYVGDEHFNFQSWNKGISPAGDFTEKQSAKRTLKNLYDEKVVSKAKDQSNSSFTLPQIKQETKNKKVAKSDDHIKNLPLIKYQNFKGNNKPDIKKSNDKVSGLLQKKAVDNKLAKVY